MISRGGALIGQNLVMDAVRRGGCDDSRSVAAHREGVGLSAPDDAGPLPRPPGLGDDGPLAVVGSVGVDDHPVVGSAQVVGPGGVREENGVVAIAAPGVEDRQPALVIGIETSGSDRRQSALADLPPVLTVDVEELLGGRPTVAAAGAGTAPPPPRLSQTTGQRIRDRLDPLGTESFDRGQATVMGRHLEFLQGLDPQLVVYPRRQPRSDSRDGCQHRLGVDLTLESLEPPPSSVSARSAMATANPRPIVGRATRASTPPRR